MLCLKTLRKKYRRIPYRIPGPVRPGCGGAQMNRVARRSRNSGRRGRWRLGRRRGNDTELFAQTMRRTISNCLIKGRDCLLLVCKVHMAHRRQDLLTQCQLFNSPVRCTSQSHPRPNAILPTASHHTAFVLPPESSVSIPISSCLHLTRQGANLICILNAQ